MTLKQRTTNIEINQLEKTYSDLKNSLNWSCPFVLPFWLAAWYENLDKMSHPFLYALHSNNGILGIAPLLLTPKDKAVFLGSESVCDYQDVILGSHDPVHFFTSLLHHLKEKGIHTLTLGALKQDSKVYQILPQVCQQMGHSLSSDIADHYYEMTLPSTWEDYLFMLDGKQRHEVRRKMRRLSEAGQIRFNIVDSYKDVNAGFTLFLEMFEASRQDKADFLTSQMASYFKSLAFDLAKNNMLRLGVLTIDQNPVAITFCFEYQNMLYLYNNGYNTSFKNLSVGLLCKIYSIRYAIDNGLSGFNFLKGNEKYKKHLGGQKHPLYRLTVSLNGS